MGNIRTVTINNEPWFCLADICKALELEQVSRVKARLNEDGVTTSKVIDKLGRGQDATFINEANLYKTIFQSRKDSAEKFTDWVTSEVLPSIRKTGSYKINKDGVITNEVIDSLGRKQEAKFINEGVAKAETPSGIQEMTIVNESGMYALIFGSKMLNATKTN